MNKYTVTIYVEYSATDAYAAMDVADLLVTCINESKTETDSVYRGNVLSDGEEE